VTHISDGAVQNAGAENDAQGWKNDRTGGVPRDHEYDDSYPAVDMYN